MLLSQYLEDRDLTYLAFGQLIGVTASSVFRYAMGDRIPRREVMERIVNATEGLVQPNDFFEAKAVA